VPLILCTDIVKLHLIAFGLLLQALCELVFFWGAVVSLSVVVLCSDVRDNCLDGGIPVEWEG
jgi:hypothetical protein